MTCRENTSASPGSTSPADPTHRYTRIPTSSICYKPSIMRLPELWTWLNGVPGSRYAKMMADDTQHPIGIRDLENVTSSDRSYFSLPEQAVIPRPSPAIVPSTPEPSTGPASTASFLSSSANLLNVLQHTHPPIYWDRDVRLPESVRALRERLVTNFGHGVIPTEFRVCTPYGIKYYGIRNRSEWFWANCYRKS